MTVHFIIGSLIGGGAERVLVLIADSLAKKGHDVSVITFNEPEDYKVSKRVKRIRLHKENLKIHRLRRLLNLFTFYRKKENRPDITVSFITDINFVVIPICKLFGLKLICSEHFNHNRKGSIFVQFTRTILYRFADILTVLTEYDIDFYKRKGANVRVMPNPCTFGKIQSSEKKRENTILAIGNLDKYNHKGFDNLVTLAHPVLKKHPDWKLKIVGGGEKGKEHLKQVTGTLGSNDQILFLGFRTDIQNLMEESAIFILSSRREGLPMVLIEAMSQGLACISYDCKTGPSDIITHEYDGLLIEDQNHGLMAKELESLMLNSEVRRQFGKRAKESVKKFDLEKITIEWEKLFSQLRP